MTTKTSGGRVKIEVELTRKQWRGLRAEADFLSAALGNGCTVEDLIVETIETRKSAMGGDFGPA